jgi:hypothetical protein
MTAEDGDVPGAARVVPCHASAVDSLQRNQPQEQEEVQAEDNPDRDQADRCPIHEISC